jgi:hypothetical protein
MPIKKKLKNSSVFLFRRCLGCGIGVGAGGRHGVVVGGGPVVRSDTARPTIDQEALLTPGDLAGLLDRVFVRPVLLLGFFCALAAFAGFAGLGVHFFDFLSHFFLALGVEFLFVGFEFMEESEEFAGVHAFFVGDVFEDIDGQFVVGGFSQLHIELNGFVLGGDHETNGSHQFGVAEFFVAGHS